MDVSENNGTPKSCILIGCSIINHPFWGTPIFGNTQIDMFFHIQPRWLQMTDESLVFDVSKSDMWYVRNMFLYIHEHNMCIYSTVWYIHTYINMYVTYAWYLSSSQYWFPQQICVISILHRPYPYIKLGLASKTQGPSQGSQCIQCLLPPPFFRYESPSLNSLEKTPKNFLHAKKCPIVIQISRGYVSLWLLFLHLSITFNYLWNFFRLLFGTITKVTPLPASTVGSATWTFGFGCMINTKPMTYPWGRFVYIYLHWSPYKYLEINHSCRWIPSRELTYPPKMAFWRWCSYSQGGIC